MVVSKWKEKLKLILLPVVPFTFAVGWLFYVFGDKPRRPHNVVQKNAVQIQHRVSSEEIREKFCDVES